MPLRPLSRGLSRFRREPVRGAVAKMGLPWDAYYVLTKAEAGLTNSKVHPNSGAPDYNITHLVADFGDIDTSYLKIDGSNADQDIDIGLFDFAAVDVTGTGTGKFAIVNATDEDNVLQVDGTTILRTGTPTNYNVFLGEEAFANDEGQYNVGIGYQAGYNNDTTGIGNEGDSNIYIGYKSGYGFTADINNTGTSNVGIGANSLYDNTTGVFNVAIGADSLGNNTSGNSNMAIGKSALFGNLIGTQNVAIGQEALAKTRASGNVGVGYQALTSNINGSNNIAVGANSLAECLSSNNVGIGNNCGKNITSALFNTAIGFYAEYKNTSGYSNVAIGAYSDGYAGAVSNIHDKNTMIGSYSGRNISTGSDNVFIGYESGFNQLALGNRLIIDNQNRTSVALEITNCLIYGIFDAAVANQSLRINGLIRGSYGAYIGDGGVTNYTEIATDGTLTFVGTAGLSHGDIYGIDETVTCTTQNTWYQATFDTAGPSNQTTVSTANNDITVLAAGAYHIGLTVCCHSAVSHDFEVMVKKNNGATDIHSSHLFQTTAVANQVENMAGSCNVSFAHDDTVEVWVRCTDAAAIDFIMDHLDLNIMQVGGT